MQQGRWLQNYSGSENTCRTHEEGAQSSDNPIRDPEIRSSFAAAVQDQELMSNQHQFGHHRPHAARSQKSEYGNDHVNEKDEDVAHVAIVSKPRKTVI